jgi:hypothetical protein
MENTYQVGNTVRLKCIFKDFTGKETNPSLVRVKIYNQSYQELSSILLTQSNNDTIGSWFYDYVIPMDAKGKLYYEWYGEIAGSPSLKRDSFKVAFV